MTEERHKTDLKTTAKVTGKHMWGLVFWNIIGFFIRSIIYAGIVFGGTYYIVSYQDYPGWSWLVAIIIYGLILFLSFVLRVRAVINGAKGAALDAAEEMIAQSDNKSVRSGAKGFKVLRWFIG